MRSILRRFLRFFFRTFTRLEVEGIENIPSEGGAILAANHLGIFDAPLVFSLINRDDATALAAKKHRNNPLYRWFVDRAEGIWIDRENLDLKALRSARKLLQSGGLLGIAPEGTRSKTGALQKAKEGVGFLALKVAAPVVPIAITGTEKAIKLLLRFRKPLLKVKVGEAINLTRVMELDKQERIQRATNLIMHGISEMMPTEYRGYYQ